jgi:PilZ domain
VARSMMRRSPRPMQLEAVACSLSCDYQKKLSRRKVSNAALDMASAQQVRIERRGGHRFTQYQVPVVLRAGDDSSGVGFTLDLSCRGALLRTDFQLATGQVIDMILAMPSEITLTEEMNVRCRARVLRLENDRGGRPAVAIKIEHYEFLPQDTSLAPGATGETHSVRS